MGRLGFFAKISQQARKYCNFSCGADLYTRAASALPRRVLLMPPCLNSVVNNMRTVLRGWIPYNNSRSIVEFTTAGFFLSFHSYWMMVLLTREILCFQRTDLNYRLTFITTTQQRITPGSNMHSHHKRCLLALKNCDDHVLCRHFSVKHLLMLLCKFKSDVNSNRFVSKIATSQLVMFQSQFSMRG